MTRDLVVIGASWGGVQALVRILGDLAHPCPAAIAIVQHRGSGGRNLLGDVLQRHTAAQVVEPDHRTPIVSGRVYLAPADYHLLVEPDWFVLSTEARVNYSRPSIDALFESAADAYGPAVLAVVLTGASEDSARGASAVRQRGGTVLVQDPATADSAVAPRAAIACGAAHEIVRLDDMARRIDHLIRAPVGAARGR